MALLFKNDDVENEFLDRDLMDPRSVGMLYALAWWMEAKTGKDIIVTDLIRHTGRDDSPHKITPGNPRCRAWDVRCHYNYFTSEELTELRVFLRTWFPRSDMMVLEDKIQGWFGTVRIHGKEANEHIHGSVEPLKQQLTALFGEQLP